MSSETDQARVSTTKDVVTSNGKRKEHLLPPFPSDPPSSIYHSVNDIWPKISTNEPDGSKHGTIAFVLEHIDRLLGERVARLAKDLPSGEERDESRLGDVAPQSKEDSLGSGKNFLTNTIGRNETESEGVSDGGHDERFEEERKGGW